MFITGIIVFNRHPWRSIWFISDNSFEIYLYHYMFMWPPLSVMSLTNNWLINSLTALCCAFFSAWVMHKGVQIINGKFT